MNLADFSSVVVVLIFAIGTPSAANAAGAPLWSVLFLVVVGVGIGVGASFLNSRMMYRFLGVGTRNGKKSEGNIILFTLYMLWPLVYWTGATAAAVGMGNLAAYILMK
jgi:hypothetical protein